MLRDVLVAVLVTTPLFAEPQSQPARAFVDVGDRLQLFLDKSVVAEMRSSHLELHHPESAGTVLRFDRPWEGPEAAYVTVIKDDRLYRMYYRGVMTADPM